MDDTAAAEEAQRADAQLLAAAAKKPLDEQVVYKSWKVRKQAYECMLAQLAQDPSSHVQFAQLASKAVADGNQGAQDVACDLLLVLLEKCESQVLQPVATDLADSLVGNALNSRPAIVAKAKEALLRLVEHGFVNDVIAANSKAYSHKAPKVALAAAESTLETVRAFGPSEVPPTLIVKPLLQMFDAKNEKLRKVAKDVVIELAKWLGTERVRTTILPKVCTQLIEQPA
jgi:hypothetical protein